MSLTPFRPDYETKVALKARTEARKNLATAEDLNELLVGVQALYDASGWEAYSDGQYTELNKRSLTADAAANITIDGATSQTDQAPAIAGHTPFWEGNLIRSNNDGATLSVRLNFSASIASNDGYISYTVFIGPSFDIPITSGLLLFPKGANVTQEFSEVIKLFSRATFVATGARIVFTPSANALLWNQNIFIESKFSGR